MQIYETQCYGCGACRAICPHHAIEMIDGPEGVKPQVDLAKCTQCGLCSRVCPDQCSMPQRRPEKAWAAACRDEKVLHMSASGGVFWALAKAILDENGVVFGCAMPEGEKRPRHIMVDSSEQLPLLQGSKYAQSTVEAVYPQVRQQLKIGKRVLFSGTPCQVAGLYSFLQGREVENLLTVDLICHGVPSGTMLEDYLTHVEKKKRIHIRSFSFRGKGAGWGSFRFQIRYKTAAGKDKNRELPSGRSSFYWLFLKGASYRENCYHCPYASTERVADLTIGDFWGIQETYPELLGREADQLDPQNGISCVLVNSPVGERALVQAELRLKLHPVRAEAIAKHNLQLQRPQEKPAIRETVMALYQAGGYAAVERWYQKRLGWKRWLYPVLDKMKR